MKAFPPSAPPSLLPRLPPCLLSSFLFFLFIMVESSPSRYGKETLQYSTSHRMLYFFLGSGPWGQTVHFQRVAPRTSLVTGTSQQEEQDRSEAAALER